MQQNYIKERLVSIPLDKSSLYTVLIKRTIYNIDDIKYVIEVIKTQLLSFANECFILIGKYKNDVSLDFYVNRFAEAYCPADFNWYKYYDIVMKNILKYKLEGAGINSVLQYLEYNRLKNAPYAEIPTYIKKCENPNKVDLSLPIVDEHQLTDEQMIKFIFELAERENMLFDCPEGITPHKALLDKMIEYNEDQKNHIYAKFMDTVRKDLHLFMKYGPVNEYIDEIYTIIRNDDNTLNHNTIYGGARMFLDNSSNPDEEGFSTISTSKKPQEWFSGHCYVCKKKIKSYRYAVRLPMVTCGGWFGCYCSWECVDDIILDDVNINLQKKLISKIKNAMITYGIYDDTIDVKQ